MGCRRPAAAVVKHPEHGRRAVCSEHATGQVVVADV
jgi:hypothetical protein